MFWFFKKSSDTAKKDEEVAKKEQSPKSSRRSERKDLAKRTGKSLETIKTTETAENSLLMPTVFEHVNADAPPAVTRMRKHQIFKTEEEETTQVNGDKRKSSTSEQKSKKRKKKRSDSKKAADEKDESRIRQLEEELERMRGEVGALTLTVGELQRQLTTVHAQLLDVQGLKKQREVLPSTFQPTPLDESWLRSDKPIQPPVTPIAESAIRPSPAADSAPKYVIKDYRLIGGKLVPYYVPQLPQPAAPSDNAAPKSSDSSKEEKSTYLGPQF